MEALEQFAVSNTAKNESVQVVRAENGFVLHYNYFEHGPTGQKQEQRSLVVTEETDLGSTILALFKA